jgi:hypothetical protein
MIVRNQLLRVRMKDLQIQKFDIDYYIRTSQNKNLTIENTILTQHNFILVVTIAFLQVRFDYILTIENSKQVT